jgi:hypothetical protein
MMLTGERPAPVPLFKHFADVDWPCLEVAVESQVILSYKGFPT